MAADLDEIAAWLRAKDPSLAVRWLEAAEKAVVSVAESPYLWAADRTGVRSMRVTPFSYRLIYRVLSNSVEIVAFTHPSRRPGHWRKRLKE